MAFINVNVDLGEFDMIDLAWELEDRLERHINQEDWEIIKKLYNKIEKVSLKKQTLESEMKAEYFNKVLEKYTLSFIEQQLPE